MKQEKVLNIIESFYISEDKSKTPGEKKLIIEINDLVDFFSKFCKSFISFSKEGNLSKEQIIRLVQKTKEMIIKEESDPIIALRKIVHLIKIKSTMIKEMENENE